MRDYAADVDDLSMGVLVEYMHTGLYGPDCPVAVRERVNAMMSAASPAGAAAALRGRAARTVSAFPSAEDRDAMIASGMERGVHDSAERLEELLGELQAS